MNTTRDDDTEMASSESNLVQRLSAVVPSSRAFWMSIVVATALVLVGFNAVNGPVADVLGQWISDTMAGVLGLWGVSLYAVALLSYLGYRVWYRFGS